MEISALSPNTVVETTLGYFPTNRAVPDGCRDKIEPVPGASGENPVLPAPVIFDPISGRLLVGLNSQRTECGHCDSYPWLFCSNTQPCPNNNRCVEDRGYPGIASGHSAAAIGGFTTLFEILQSYQPSTVHFAITVPYMPEGLRAADRFDTYWGWVTRPLDLSQAHTLQCAYPDHQPQVGEFLTFPDAAPTPSPGQAVYYLTSVTYQGQTRAGRQALDGRLSGRDATALPACTLEK